MKRVAHGEPTSQQLTATTAEHRGDVALFLPGFAPVFGPSEIQPDAPGFERKLATKALRSNKIALMRKCHSHDRRGSLVGARCEQRRRGRALRARSHCPARGIWMRAARLLLVRIPRILISHSVPS